MPLGLKAGLLCKAEVALVCCVHLWVLQQCVRARPVLVLFAAAAVAQCVPPHRTDTCRRQASSGILLGATLLPLLFSSREGDAFRKAFYVAWGTGLLVCVARALRTQLRLPAVIALTALCVRMHAHADAVSAAPYAVVGAAAFAALTRGVPGSLTFGEAAVLAQLWAILTAVVVGHAQGDVRLTKLRTAITLGTFGAVGVAAVIVRLSAAGVRSAAVYFLAAAGGAAGVLTWISAALGQNSLLWLWRYCTARAAAPLQFLAYYAVVLGVGLRATPREFRPERKTIARKWFHVLAVVMFAPTIVLHLRFMSLAFAVGLAIFVVVESLRIAEAGSFAAAVDSAIRTYVDERDGGKAVLTHIHLLLGCALPVWYTFFAHHGGNFSAKALLSAMAGVCATGVGDAAASVVGSSVGRVRWPRSRKTVEGSLAMVFSIVCFQLLCLWSVGFHGLAAESWAVLIASDVAVCLLEASTDQIDNLVLPLFHLLLLQRV
eukprot:TRINITY_DN24435_c0_g1_i1.p1 TRINITY_DN24435_c0_g1~~TRINITY_DN24435_c0_g1_i1.p1  ORF type:complete len:514 (+),score=108.63 TRINITY_DN24435_c0_g1_i1:76-1542(+)